jgi:hypothetical protein
MELPMKELLYKFTLPLGILVTCSVVNAMNNVTWQLGMIEKNLPVLAPPAYQPGTIGTQTSLVLIAALHGADNTLLEWLKNEYVDTTEVLSSSSKLTLLHMIAINLTENAMTVVNWNAVDFNVPSEYVEKDLSTFWKAQNYHKIYDLRFNKGIPLHEGIACYLFNTAISKRTAAQKAEDELRKKKEKTEFGEQKRIDAERKQVALLAPDIHGLTPLHYIFVNKYEFMIQLFFKNEILDWNTPIRKAREENLPHVVQILEEGKDNYLETISTREANEEQKLPTIREKITRQISGKSNNTTGKSTSIRISATSTGSNSSKSKRSRSSRPKASSLFGVEERKADVSASVDSSENGK